MTKKKDPSDPTPAIDAGMLCSPRVVEGPPVIDFVWDRFRQSEEPPRRPYPTLRFFEVGHLPPHLAEVAAPFCALAKMMADTLPRCEETRFALRKLLEAKDWAVRAKSSVE